MVTLTPDSSSEAAYAADDPGIRSYSDFQHKAFWVNVSAMAVVDNELGHSPPTPSLSEHHNEENQADA